MRNLGFGEAVAQLDAQTVRTARGAQDLFRAGSVPSRKPANPWVLVSPSVNQAATWRSFVCFASAVVVMQIGRAHV